ncbi:Zinc finger protein CONSTANS-LIKE 14 [Bienertia sinuspersici]
MKLECDYCAKNAAVLYCEPDSANLCLLCDREIHSANSLSLKHVRIPRFGISNPNSEPKTAIDGCPSAVELAPIWGINDLVVPCLGDDEKDAVLKQLVKLSKWDLDERETGSEVGPGTPSLEAVDASELFLQNIPFTSMLMNNDGEDSFFDDEDFPWEFDPDCHSSQVWDGEWGRPEDECEMQYSPILRGSQSKDDDRNQTMDCEAFETVDNCSVPFVGPSSDTMVKPETFDGDQNFQLMEWPFLRKPLSKDDMDQLAENRGKAMIRYKEKKKTRRQLLT